MFAVVLGCMAWSMPFVYEKQTLDKIFDELQSVNESVHSNVNQFSLVPFTGACIRCLRPVLCF